MSVPEPLVSNEVDISGMPGFMLDVQRLFASELWALSTGDEFKAAMALWGRAWQQKPAGSLPNDDRILAGFSGAGANWPNVREVALRGFIECSDGRLYHKTLCDDVNVAWEKRVKFRARTSAATEARLQRNEQRNDDRNENRYVHPVDVDGDIKEENKISKDILQKDQNLKSPKKAKARTSLDPDWKPDEKGMEYATSHGIPRSAIPTECENFRNNHTARGTLSADWSASWRTWCGNYQKFNAGKLPNQRAGPRLVPASLDIAFDTVMDAIDRRTQNGQEPNHQNYIELTAIPYAGKA